MPKRKARAAAGEAGYIYVYLSYENQSDNFVFFDDFTVTHTKTNVLQYNEYYPFGMQASTSWTREDRSNQYLYNGGNELNKDNGWYETFFRGYDPAIGRFLQIDPLSFREQATYQYAGNNPVMFNDPLGAYKIMSPQEQVEKTTLIETWRTESMPTWMAERWRTLGVLSISGSAYMVEGMRSGGKTRGKAGVHRDGNGNLIIDMDDISDIGGTWSPEGGYRDFESEDEAFAAGVAYNSRHGSWGNTYYGSYQYTVIGYLALIKEKKLLSPETIKEALEIVKSNHAYDGKPNFIASVSGGLYLMQGGYDLLKFQIYNVEGQNGPLGGISIKIGFNDTRGIYGELRWVQTVRTNLPLYKGVTSPYNDPPNDGDWPFYRSDNDYDEYETVFSDNPSRYLSSDSYWIAELSLVSRNSDNTFSPVFTIQYGFINAGGGTSLFPIQQISPSQTHLNSFINKKY